MEIEHRTLHFKRPATTSRGAYEVREVDYVILRDGDRVGIGECAPLPGLSVDDSAMQFAIETAELHLRAGSWAFYDTPFSRSEQGLLTNGLVWMAPIDDMAGQVKAKVDAGFGCIKIKIGALDFEEELSLLRSVRRLYPQIELRLDANGAFGDDAYDKLCALEELRIHSIEQPIRAGQWEAMADLCRRSAIPIALDEELIGVQQRAELLDAIRPAYVILKPTLHGGLSGTKQWADLAAERGIGHWYTSALESNVGLNAIAQTCAYRGATMPQGLGTGMLFTDNIPSPLRMEGERLCYRPS